VEFKRIYEQEREKLPLGIAQIGHAVRNEISPRQGLIRLREFTIMDVEFFFDPEEPCPWLKTVGDETLCLIPAERKLKKQKEPVIMTAREAVIKGIVKTEWQAFFMALAKRLLIQLGVPEDKQRFIEKLPWEKAHYSLQSFDQEIFLDRWDWTEVSGLAYRTDYDLKRHMQHSGTDMRVYKEFPTSRVREVIAIRPNLAKLGPAFKKDAGKIAEQLKNADPKEIQEALEKKGHFTLGTHSILPEHVEITHEKIEEKGNRFIPHVIEPSFGSDRLAYIALEYAYECKEDRTFLKFPRDIAPIQAGIFPLMNKDGLNEKATEIAKQLTNEGLAVEYDDSGSIGRRYARMDEIGTPLCITIDYITLKDETVTVRDRDTWKQVRTCISQLAKLLHEYFNYGREFKDLGEPLKE
jgi:glycyl-tRNA synthetase